MPTGFVIGDRGLGASGDTHPGWISAHAVAGPYLVVGGSAVGHIHRHGGRPRDDAFVVRRYGPWLAVAVSDGLGSRPLSRYGATYAVESLSALLLRPFVPCPPPVPPEGHPGSPPLERLAPPGAAEEMRLVPEMREPLPSARDRKWARQALGRSLTERLLARSSRPQPAEEPAAEPESDAPPDTPPSAFLQVGSIGWNAVERDDEAGPPTDAPERDVVKVVQDAFKTTHMGLRQHADGLKVKLTELGCTAVALLLNVETGRGAVGQVGDGAVLGLTADGKLKELVQAADTGDPQATYTLTNPQFDKALAVQIIEPLAVDPYVAFYVMTDGVSGDVLYSADNDAVVGWARAIDRNVRLSDSPAQAAAGLLNWLATYVVKGSWDDRTLVVISKRESNDGHRDIAAGQPEPAGPTDDGGPTGP